MKILSFFIYVISICSAYTLYASEKFELYGFMDYHITPYLSMKNNSPLRAFVREDISFGSDNLNIYFDFNPSPMSRAMIETSFRINNHATQSHSGPEIFFVERAWIEGIVSDFVKLRAGRFITPAGIWNVDHGSPVITTIAAPVQTTWFPIFPKSQLGLMLHGTYFLGNHDLQYNLYNSSGSNVNNHIRSVQDIAWGGHLELNMDKLQQLEFGVSAMTGMLRQDYLKVTVLPPPGAQTLEAQDIWYSNEDTTNMREVMYGTQFKAKFSQIGVQSEINLRHLYNTLDHWRRTDIIAGYVLVSYEQILSKNLTLTPYIYTEYLQWNNPQNNPALRKERTPIDSWFNNNVGLNLGIFTNMHIKGEFTWAKLNPINRSLYQGVYQGVYIQNNFQAGDLDIYTVEFQFSMAF